MRRLASHEVILPSDVVVYAWPLHPTWKEVYLSPADVLYTVEQAEKSLARRAEETVGFWFRATDGTETPQSMSDTLDQLTWTEIHASFPPSPPRPPPTNPDGTPMTRLQRGLEPDPYKAHRRTP